MTSDTFKLRTTIQLEKTTMEVPSVNVDDISSIMSEMDHFPKYPLDNEYFMEGKTHSKPKVEFAIGI